jgi:hypothetical protein
MSADPDDEIAAGEVHVDGDDMNPEESPKPAAETEWQRRRRLAAVFGDVLPETTSDERDESESGTAEEWLKRQVPPHHG